MTPPAAVAEMYFGHPASRYFSARPGFRTEPAGGLRGPQGGKIDEAERSLRPNLGDGRC